jgi:5-deoxy-glucuronate isomerase
MAGRLVSGTAGRQGRNIFVHPGNSSMRNLSYGRIRLDGEQSCVSFGNEDQETGLICLQGAGTVSVGAQQYPLSANDALYLPRGSIITVQTSSSVDMVECAAPVEGTYPIQFVSHKSVRLDPRLHLLAGGAGSQREIEILLGSNISAGRLLVGITRSAAGNWTSWPPHEHASMLEEIYVFFDMPQQAFGLQLVYEDDITSAHVEVVRDGDAVLLPGGYHPNVAIPGVSLNFVWIMAAHREVIDRQWGVVHSDARYT